MGGKKLALATGLLGLLAVAAVAWWLTRTPANETLSRESFNEMQITDFPGEEVFPSLAPDGQDCAVRGGLGQTSVARRGSAGLIGWRL